MCNLTLKRTAILSYALLNIFKTIRLLQILTWHQATCELKLRTVLWIEQKKNKKCLVIISFAVIFLHCCELVSSLAMYASPKLNTQARGFGTVHVNKFIVR